eukprot:1163323-Amphidinium_carterae.1
MELIACASWRKRSTIVVASPPVAQGKHHSAAWNLCKGTLGRGCAAGRGFRTTQAVSSRWE